MTFINSGNVTATIASISGALSVGYENIKATYKTAGGTGTLAPASGKKWYCLSAGCSGGYAAMVHSGDYFYMVSEGSPNVNFVPMYCVYPDTIYFSAEGYVAYVEMDI